MEIIDEKPLGLESGQEVTVRTPDGQLVKARLAQGAENWKVARMSMRQTVYVAGYPKSGCTWLTRLLGDALNSPTGGCMPGEDAKEVATEGQDRPGPYVVRKGHFKLIPDDAGPVVPRPHRLAWRRITDEKVVFIVRDPRDVCVSGAHYWRTSPEDFLNRMVAGRVAKLPRWDRYVEQWLKLSHRRYQHLHGLPFVKYEKLLEDTENTLRWLLKYTGLEHDSERIRGAVQRQSFAARLKSYDGPHPDQHKRIMRKGVAGAWREHFNRRMGQICQMHFGAVMARLGYIENMGWWRELAG